MPSNFLNPILVLFFFIVVPKIGFALESSTTSTNLASPSTTGHPDSGFWRCDDTSQLAESGFGVLTSKLSIELLNHIQQRVRARIIESDRLFGNLETCLIASAPPAECEELLTWALKTLPQVAIEARMELALSASPFDFYEYLAGDYSRLNKDLKSPGLYKKIDWAPLSKSELEIAQSSLNADIKVAREKLTEILNNPASKPDEDPEEIMKAALGASRYDHYLRYQKLLTDFGILHYMKSPFINKESLIQIIKIMRKDLRTEKELLVQAIHGFETGSTSLLELLNYESFAQSALYQHHEWCPAFNSLNSLRLKYGIAKSLAIALPIIAASVVFPPSLGLALSVGSGLGFSLYGEYTFYERSTLVTSHIYTQDLGFDHTRLSADARAKTISWLTLPLAFTSLTTIAQKGQGAIVAIYNSVRTKL